MHPPAASADALLLLSAWVNRFAVNADYALETSQTALTEVKKIWKNSADTLTLATGWLKDHLTIGAQGRGRDRNAHPDAPAPCCLDPALLAVPQPFGPQQQPQQQAAAAAAAGGTAATPSTSTPPAAAAAAAVPAAVAAAAPASAMAPATKDSAPADEAGTG